MYLFKDGKRRAKERKCINMHEKLYIMQETVVNFNLLH